MGLAQEDIQFIKDNMSDWLTAQPPSNIYHIKELDQRERIIRVEEELKHQRELMITQFKQTEKRFEQVDKRFEQVDKRFEEILDHMNNRFAQVDKRFEQVDKRFEEILNYMNKRFEQVDKRFEEMLGYMNKRFEQVDKSFAQVDRRIEQINQNIIDLHKGMRRFMIWNTSLIVGAIGVFVAVSKYF